MKTIIIDLDRLEKSPSLRYGHSTCIVGEFLFLFGGCTTDGKTFLRDLNVLDLSDEKMKWVEKFQADIVQGRHFHTCTPTSNDPKTAKLIFFGGKSNGYLNDVFTYEIATKEFTVVEHRFKNQKNLKSCVNDSHHPPTPRYGHSACYYDEKIFIFGGYDKNAFSKNDLHCFNFKTNMWKKFVLARIPRRFHHSGVCIGSNLFILGGITSSYTPLNDVYRLDLSKYNEKEDDDHGVEAFELTIENPIASYGHKCFILQDDQDTTSSSTIYMFGGRDPKNEFRHFLRLDQEGSRQGFLKWEKIGEIPDQEQFSVSYGSLDVLQPSVIQENSNTTRRSTRLLFFGGQARRRKSNEKKKKTEEEEEGEDEEDEEKNNYSNQLPYDCVFVCLSFLGYNNKRDLISISSTSKKWIFSFAARSDLMWKDKYEFAVRNSCIKERSYGMKKVKRMNTCYEKFKMLKKQEGIWKRKKLKKVEGIENIKIVFTGDGATGKTCLCIVYAVEDHSFPTEYIPTVFDNYTETVKKFGKEFELGLWDTAGEEDFDELRPLYYTGAHVMIITASIDSYVSVENIKRKWIPEVRKHVPDSHIVLCMNKIDLRNDKRTIRYLKEKGHEMFTRKDGEKLAKEVGALRYFETSALENIGVSELFSGVVSIALGLDHEHGVGGVSNEKCWIM